MPSYDSPIGRKNFSGQGMRDFSVTDESQPPQHRFREDAFPDEMPSRQVNSIPNDADFEREVQYAREAKRSGKERLNEGAKRRIEMLIGMTQTTRQFSVENNNFILRSLKSKEMKESLLAVAEYDGTIQAPYEMRKQILARSLTHVADVEIEQFIGSNTLESKMLFLDELDESLLTRLYDEYLLLTKTTKEKFAIKNDKDAEEVVENIKK